MTRRGFASLIMAAVLPASGCSQDHGQKRESLVRVVAAEMATIGGPVGHRLDPEVAGALGAVERHRFVPPELESAAYANHPLPIGSGQTISQPLIVALMSQLLEVGPSQRVLEIGTGSGYQAAVLAEMGVQVYSIEIVPELAERARRTLQANGYGQVHVRAGDGMLGWPEAAPFDAILLTAATPNQPDRLLEQLRPGAHLVMPLGAAGDVQQLIRLTKGADGTLLREDILRVRFVPITGAGGEAD